MPPWRSPEAGTNLNLRFIRTGRSIFVGNTPGDKHLDIAEMDGLNQALDELRVSDPKEVDAGFVGIKPNGVIWIVEDSGSLQLPVPKVRREAREITIKDFTEQNPNYKIIEL